MRDEPAGGEGATAARTEAEPGPAARHSGGCVLRRARPADEEALSELERAVFPTLRPLTNFRREIAKSGQAMLVAVRPGVERPPAPGASALSDDTRGPGGGGRLQRVLAGLKMLVASASGGGNGTAAGGDIAGYVSVWFAPGEAHLMSIGVREEDRRRGIGELLLLGAIEAAAEHDCATVTLEVRCSNEAARALYRKYGFRDAGLRKRYYVDNREDAVIMTTPRITDPEYAEALIALSRAHQRRIEGGRGGPSRAVDGSRHAPYPSAEPGRWPPGH